MSASRRREFGYLALVQARKNLAASVETVIVPLERDLRGGRLVAEIFTRQSDDESNMVKKQELDVSKLVQDFHFQQKKPQLTASSIAGA